MDIWQKKSYKCCAPADEICTTRRFIGKKKFKQSGSMYLGAYLGSSRYGMVEDEDCHVILISPQTPR